MAPWMRKPYDWSEDVKKLRMPVMLVYGDSDMFRPEHVVEFYKLLGAASRTRAGCVSTCRRTVSRSCPTFTHYEMFLAPELPRTVRPFLDGKSGSKSWAEHVQGKSVRRYFILQRDTKRRSSGTEATVRVRIPREPAIGRSKNANIRPSALIMELMKFSSSMAPSTMPRIAGATGKPFSSMTKATRPKASISTTPEDGVC